MGTGGLIHPRPSPNRTPRGVEELDEYSTIQSSIYDQDHDRIVELLRLGVSIRHISTHHLKYGSPSSLHYYVTTRALQVE